MFQSGEWAWSAEHRQVCKIIDAQTLWGNTIYRVWLPDKNAVVRIAGTELKPASTGRAETPSRIAYIAAAARVADAFNQDVLLAPLDASVIPLPHQIRALSRAISGHHIRYLLADEVGLGKTIEAGLILRELKLRGLARRILVVAPKGLVTQWVSEMNVHFGEQFRLILPEYLTAYRRIAPDENLWRAYDQVICPMDAVKPLERRRGWTKEQLAEYNRERFDDMVNGGWDLVIVDEAHRLGGSTDQVARFKLGQGLAEASPYLLLLSATPHQGKTDSFYRLISLLDTSAFPDVSSVSKDRVQPYVVRTEKRRAIDAEGQPLFKPRFTRLVPVSWEERHREQRLLYEAVTDYVREGYNQALKEKKSYIGFLMILMQRLVTSSTRAIRTSFERRLEVLNDELSLLSSPDIDEDLPAVSDSSIESFYDLDGQEQVETLLKIRAKALNNEQAEVRILLELAKRTEALECDAKAEAILDWIYHLQQEETNPDLKVLIFTEFVPTQGMLREFLTDRGFSVVCLNGSMDLEERKRVQESFAKESRILVSTDAGGEGLNLQFCHVVINFDMPWNPMRIEQRIGRVDRIGQTRPVHALNFVLADTVEYRVREVLEKKLGVILAEFGTDKAGDVLDSAKAGRIFDDLYLESILAPDNVDAKIDSVVSEIREETKLGRERILALSEQDELDPVHAQRVLSHPMPHWIERMTVGYLEAHGGKAENDGRLWNIVWPTGEKVQNAVFDPRDAEGIPSSHHLTLEDVRIRGISTQLPRFAPGEPIPQVVLPGVAAIVQGFWSLWRITIHTADWNRQKIMPLFQHDNGRVFLPTARRIWDELVSDTREVRGYLDDQNALQAFDRSWKAAEAHGKIVYEDLVREHQRHLAQEREKGDYAFASRRRSIERIGLRAVRSHRLAQLEREEQHWLEQLKQKAGTSPEMVPLLLIRVEGFDG